MKICIPWLSGSIHLVSGIRICERAEGVSQTRNVLPSSTALRNLKCSPIAHIMPHIFSVFLDFLGLWASETKKTLRHLGTDH